ncbi:MAG: hypothetical protein J6W35_08275 [Eubacterium sp.]|nr:hypothetical protein [Eubacterium sp.]
MEAENKVWVVSGEEWYDEEYKRIVIAVCPTKEDAENVKFRVELERDFDEIWIENFYVKTHDKASTAYIGRFRLEISLFGENHYVLRGITFIDQKQIAMSATFKEKFEFSMNHIIKTDGPETYVIMGEFNSIEKVPTEGDAARQWLVQKVNEKGLITLESSGF